MQIPDPSIDEFLEAFLLNYGNLSDRFPRLSPPLIEDPPVPDDPFAGVVLDWGDEENNQQDEEMEDYYGVEAADPEGLVFDLTQDLLYKVFSHLDAPGLCSVAQVCRQWGAMSVHEDFWHTLDFTRKELRTEDVVDVCKKFSNASTVLMGNGNRLDEYIVQKALGRLRNLTSLSITDAHNNLSSADHFFRALTQHCRALTTLSVTNVMLTSSMVVISHPQLQTLVLDHTHNHGLRLACPALKSLSLQHATLSGLLLECPLLESVNVGACAKLADVMLRTALVACPALKRLDVSGCALVTDDTMRQVAVACARLERLDASHCPLLTFSNVRFPALLEFTAMGCEGVATSCVNMLGYAHQLESLTLDYCWTLAALELELYHLQNVSLFNCRMLSDVKLRTPRLSSLRLDSCGALRKVDIYSAELRALALRGQPFLREVRLRGPELTSLDLTECDGLHELTGEAFLDPQACPKMTSLVLDNCEGLTRLTLASPSLSRLSLAGCSGLSAVDLACPALTSLATDGCNRLATARLAPVALADVSLGTCPHLASLCIQSAELAGLDLRGCGALEGVELDCPAMTRLDTSYCSKLSSLSLAPMAAKCRALSTLVLAGAVVSLDGLMALSELKNLSRLDLSYTEIESLEPIFSACTQLKALLLSACKRLPDAALTPLHFGLRLPLLEELDVSYCNLSAGAVGELLARAPHIARFSFNGCSKLDDSIWDRLAEPPEGSPKQRDERPGNCFEQRDQRSGESPEQGDERPGGPPEQRDEHPGVATGQQQGGLEHPRDGSKKIASEPLTCPPAPRVLGDPSEESPGRSEGLFVGVMGSPGKVAKRLREVNLGDGNGGRGEVRQRKLTTQEMTSFENTLVRHPFTLDEGAGKRPVERMTALESPGGEKAEGAEKPSVAATDLSAVAQDSTVSHSRFLGPSAEIPEIPVAEAQVEELQSRESQSDELQSDEPQIGGDPMEFEHPRRMLTSLSLVGCNGLRSVRLETCPELTDLNASLCGNVRQARVTCPKLVQLNLSQCGRLTAAAVQCSTLRTLNIQGCQLDDSEVLGMARGCPALETLDVRSCVRMRSDDTVRTVRELCPGIRRLHCDAH
ncbi:F-box family protein [Klebsormidium nitens]|uniref:F-box family protein n=1 Tax=Klebsormidium nitens TaxID=105231 RepID=A0A1Y1IEA1_KLENI|nr:F-box family protein [Klebsormidium nitens]|eukprot:GAQ87431.1 F-box family protein [Klebsormidium nitens]